MHGAQELRQGRQADFFPESPYAICVIFAEVPFSAFAREATCALIEPKNSRELCLHGEGDPDETCRHRSDEIIIEKILLWIRTQNQRGLTRISHNVLLKGRPLWYNVFSNKKLNQKKGRPYENRV